MDAARHTELTTRLQSLIDLLLEDGGPCPPQEAAATWSEASIRRWFDSAGAHAPGPDASQPGGGVPQPAAPAAAPAALIAAQDALTVEKYRAAAFQRGIPPRPHGLFPPGCPVLGRIAADSSYAPFEKHLVNASGHLSPALVSWPVGDEAAARGIDLRYFAQRINGKEKSTLLAAVRYGDSAGIGGKGFHTGAHGGAIETAFDEVCLLLLQLAWL